MGTVLRWILNVVVFSAVVVIGCGLAVFLGLLLLLLPIFILIA